MNPFIRCYPLHRTNNPVNKYLLTEPMADLFALTWRPDGAALAYLRSDLAEGAQPVPDVSVWTFDFASGEPVFVAGGGVLPRWLP